MPLIEVRPMTAPPMNDRSDMSLRDSHFEKTKGHDYSMSRG